VKFGSGAFELKGAQKLCILDMAHGHGM